MSFKLKTFAALAMAGTLAACETRTAEEIAADPNAIEVSVPTENIRVKNEIDASQMLNSRVQAVEFTPVTDPSKQCMTIIYPNGYGGGAGGLQCWDKKLPAPLAP